MDLNMKYQIHSASGSLQW